MKLSLVFLNLVGFSRLIGAFVVVKSTTRRASTGLHLFYPPEKSEYDERHIREFKNLEPLPETDVRKQRMERDIENRAQFVAFGDDLWALRSKMDKLSEKLIDAISNGSFEEQETRAMLREAEQRDPELVYLLEKAELEVALSEGRTQDAEVHREKMLSARACLPHFNLDGLWVGKYGTHGYELINITYVGDLLIAEKVTGDKNVPRGEISFQVDLNPLKPRKSHLTDPTATLLPIVLTEKAAKKWGTRQLPRYPGLGQVAEEGFKNHQWMDGQLIIIGDQYFSFAWIPIEQQIFFGRPSPELALKMLRESGVQPLRPTRTFDAPPSMDSDIQLLKEYASRCLEKTHEVEDEIAADGVSFSCIWHDSDTDECYFE